MKIEKLIPEMEAAIPVYKERWINIGLCTDPADRPRAEKAIVKMYESGGLEPPKEIVWTESPGALIAAAKEKYPEDDPLSGCIYGCHDANWLAFYEYFREVCGLVEETEPLLGLTELARSAGWAIPYKDICWVSERPKTLKRDDQGRLHDLEGPAVEYPDGWTLYSVRGVTVPEEWIKEKECLDVKTALTWENMEQRRVAAEIIGWARIMEELEPEIIDKDSDPEIGELIRVDLPDSPRCQFLRVLCGTGRTFVLPVPPEMKTALEANAWTWDLKPEEYTPEIRT